MISDILTEILNRVTYQDLYITICVNKQWHEHSQVQLAKHHNITPYLPIIHNLQYSRDFNRKLYNTLMHFLKVNQITLETFNGNINAFEYFPHLNLTAADCLLTPTEINCLIEYNYYAIDKIYQTYCISNSYIHKDTSDDDVPDLIELPPFFADIVVINNPIIIQRVYSAYLVLNKYVDFGYHGLNREITKNELICFYFPYHVNPSLIKKFSY